MFEDKSFENIMERALDAITLDIDKSETSIVYAALAESAAEIAQVYIELEAFYNLAFAITSAGEWLEKRAIEEDVTRREATHAIRKAMFNVPVDKGERFFVDDVYYHVISDGRVEAEEAGFVGNRPPSGSDMLPLNNIPGLESAVLGDVIISGSDEQTDESLLEEYLSKRRKEAKSGNKAHYKQWAEEVEGVGKAIVIPLWAGRGTVKVIIVDSEMQPASQELMKNVKDYIAPVDGMGEGEAAIGATLTVESAVHKEISVSARATLRNDDKDEVISQISKGIRSYFKEKALKKDAVIKVSTISNIIYENDWVDDYSDVKINGSDANLNINENEIPKLIGVNLHV